MRSLENRQNLPTISTESASSDNQIQCLVFRTSLHNRKAVDNISGVLDNIPGILDWHVDLDDWENVLRIECENITAETIINILSENKVVIEEMPVENF